MIMLIKFKISKEMILFCFKNGFIVLIIFVIMINVIL